MAKKTLYPIVRDVHFTIGPNVGPGDLDLFRDPKTQKITGPVTHLDKADLFDLLVQAQCFTSKAEARKNYRPNGEYPESWTGSGPQIPTGYFEIGPIGKGRVMIFGFNPLTPPEEP